MCIRDSRLNVQIADDGWDVAGQRKGRLKAELVMSRRLDYKYVNYNELYRILNMKKMCIRDRHWELARISLPFGITGGRRELAYINCLFYVKKYHYRWDAKRTSGCCP